MAPIVQQILAAAHARTQEIEMLEALYTEEEN